MGNLWYTSRLMLVATSFIIYLNDVQRCLEFSRANMYADDRHVTLTSNNIVDLIANVHKEFRNISEWMRVNKLNANPQKTEYMVIGHPRMVIKLKSQSH